MKTMLLLCLFASPLLAQTNPDGTVGKAVIIVGGGSSISSGVDLLATGSDSTLSRINFGGYALEASVILPTSQNVSWQFSLTYNKISNDFFPANSTESSGRYDGHALNIMLYFKIYP